MFEDPEIYICWFSPLLSTTLAPWGGGLEGGGFSFLSATFLSTSVTGFHVGTSCLFME